MDDRAICMEAFRQRDGRSGYLYEKFGARESNGRSGYLYENFGAREGNGRSGYLYENFRQQAIFMRILGSAEEKDDWA